MPMTDRPPGSVPTAERITGVMRPRSTAPGSLSTEPAKRGYSWGKCSRRIPSDMARCSSAVLTESQQSMGPPGRPSKTIIWHGPSVLSPGKVKNSPTPGTMFILMLEASGSSAGTVGGQHVSDRHGALRAVEGGLGPVGGKDLPQLALPGAHHHQVEERRELLEPAHRKLLDAEVPAAADERLDPVRALDPLVHRQRRALKRALPVDLLPSLARRDVHVHPGDAHVRGVRPGDVQRLLDPQGGREHALAGGDRPGADLLGRPVGEQGDAVARPLQGEG